MRTRAPIAPSRPYLAPRRPNHDRAAAVVDAATVASCLLQSMPIDSRICTRLAALWLLFVETPTMKVKG